MHQLQWRSRQSSLARLAYVGHFFVDTSVVGVYTLPIENITAKETGVCKCVNDAGMDPDEALAKLVVTKQDTLMWQIAI